MTSTSPARLGGREGAAGRDGCSASRWRSVLRSVRVDRSPRCASGGRAREAARDGDGAALTPFDVQRFEDAYRIALPVEYRRFLLEVADGGRGPPAYGLVRFAHVPLDYGWSAEERLARLTRAFPLASEWIWENEEPLTEPRRRLRESTWLDGSLVLGTDGCGLYWHLIVTGQERDQIWCIGDVGASPCNPRRTFLSWYEDWLDRRVQTP